MPLESLVLVKSRGKHAETVASLVAMVRKMSPGARLPRVRELRNALGVTLSTLDKALKQLELRHMVERRQRSGIFVSKRIHQKAIGLVMGSSCFSCLSAPFYSMILNNCNQRAESHRNRLSFYLNLPCTDSDSPEAMAPRNLVQDLAAGKLDGLLVVGVKGDKFHAWIESHGLPLVCLRKGCGPGSVVVNMDDVTRMGASELMEEGCETLALVGNHPVDGSYFRRVARNLGFHYEEAGLQFHDWADAVPLAPEVCAARLLEYFRKTGGKRTPWGLIFLDDTFAGSVLPYLAASGVKIGSRLKIVCHSNKGSPVLAEWKRNLMLLEFDPEEMVEAMLIRLEMLMAGRNPEPEVLPIHPKLVRG